MRNESYGIEDIGKGKRNKGLWIRDKGKGIYQWLCLAPFDSFKPSLVPVSPICPCHALFIPIWKHMAPFGPLRQHLVLFDPVWSCLASF